MAPLIVLGIDGLNLLRLFTNTLDVIEQLAALTPGTQNAALTRKYNSLIGCPSRATKPDQSATVTRRDIVFCVQESPRLQPVHAIMSWLFVGPMTSDDEMNQNVVLFLISVPIFVIAGYLLAVCSCDGVATKNRN